LDRASARRWQPVVKAISRTPMCTTPNLAIEGCSGCETGAARAADDGASSLSDSIIARSAATTARSAPLQATRRTNADQLPDEEPEIESARVDQQSFQNVRVAAKMHTTLCGGQSAIHVRCSDRLPRLRWLSPDNERLQT
jgi:hypothetical protein